MVRVHCVFRRHDAQQIGFDGERRRAVRKSDAVGDAKDVRIDRHRRLAEGDIHHDVRRLAADAGQRFEDVAVGRDLAAEFVDQAFAKGR